MSKVTNSTQLQRVPDDRKWTYTSILFQQIQDILNNGILFGDNLNGQIKTVSFNAANTDVFVAHDLNRVTQYFIVLNLSAAMIVYKGSQANTVQGSFLRSSAVGTADVFLI